MREKPWSLALGVGWMIPWIVALHDSMSIWIPAVVGLLFLRLAMLRPSKWFVGLAVLVALSGGWITGQFLGVAAAGLAAGLGWSAWDIQPRVALRARFGLAFLMIAVLVVWHESWWWLLPVTLGLGLVGLTESGRPTRVPPFAWWGLGGGIVVAGAGLACIVYAVSPKIPLMAGPGLTQVVQAPPVKDLHGYLGPPGGPGHRPLHAHVTPLGRLLHGAERKHSRSTNWPGNLLFVFAGGTLLLASGFWLARRLGRWDPPLEIDRQDSPLVRQSVDLRSEVSDPTLRYTRAFVYRRMRTAQRRGNGPDSHETLREWMKRAYGAVSLNALVLYEEVRYGDTEDGPDRAAEVSRDWPKSNRVDRPTAK